VPSWHKKIGLSDAVVASAQSRLMEFNKGSAWSRRGCCRCETGVSNRLDCRTSGPARSKDAWSLRRHDPQSVDNRGLLFFQFQD